MVALLFRGTAASPYNGDWIGSLVALAAGTKTIGPSTPAPASGSVFVTFGWQGGATVALTATTGYTQPSGGQSSTAFVQRLESAYQASSSVLSVTWAGTSAFPNGGVVMMASFAPLAAAGPSFPAPILVV
jgi:hypothetical protein